jgi:hypothetical protein
MSSREQPEVIRQNGPTKTALLLFTIYVLKLASNETERARITNTKTPQMKCIGGLKSRRCYCLPRLISQPGIVLSG